MAGCGVVGILLLQVLHVGAAAHIDDEPEIAVEQVKQEAVLELHFAQLKEAYGIEDRRTLDVFFKLFDLWIMLYRLNKADAALKEVLPACEWRHDDLSIKATQAVAFTRWKQGRYREALARFHEMEGWMGKNPALCENIGHTYNTLGLYVQAERYFNEALQLTQETKDVQGANVGGILLGLAGVQDRQGAFQEALPTAVQAYEHYKDRDARRGWGSSLTAKAAMMLSKVHLNLGQLEEAERNAREALHLFEETAGLDSPLVAGALERLGDVLTRQGRLVEAQSALHRAYKVEAAKDAFNLVGILEIHNKLVTSHVKSEGGRDRGAFRSYFGVVDRVVKRVRLEMVQDGNAGAYYKTAGEMYVLGDSCALGRPLLVEASQLFAVEKSIDTSSLIKQCTDLVAYCDGNHPEQLKQQGGVSPVPAPAPEDAGRKARGWWDWLRTQRVEVAREQNLLGDL